MNITTNRNDPAFPQDRVNPSNMIGLTKRDYFAALAMQGMLANPSPQIVAANYERMADFSVKQADALIEELNRLPIVPAQ